MVHWQARLRRRTATQPPERRSLLYDKLERAVIPTFYQDRDRYVQMMRHCIALNGSFFNTHRMIQQYILKAYFG
jgi:glucan phosphorylase